MVLAYLIVDELYAILSTLFVSPPCSIGSACSTLARYALIRLPHALLSLPISQALFNLLASVSERKYTQIYPRAEALRNMVSEPSFPNTELGQVLVGMIDAFIGVYSML